MRKPLLAIWLVPPEDGDYKLGEIYLNKKGWVILKWKGGEDAVGEWYNDNIELEKTLFRQTGRNMEIIDKILTEQAIILEHRKKILELKKKLQDPIKEEHFKRWKVNA